MASSATKKTAAPAKRRAASRGAAASRKRRAKKLIDDVTAILLISPDAKKLCAFYQAALGLPIEAEVHDGMPVHYACDLGKVHFAIHNADGWPGVPTRNAQSPVVCFSARNLKAVVKRLFALGVKVTGPSDHGFAQVLSFRDPDGNQVSVLE